MIDGLLIEPETGTDAPAIFALTQAAFAPMRYSSGREGPIVEALRASGALHLSLVARRAGEIVGHIAFSPVQIGQMAGDWFGLGPVSVRPDLQRMGIGSLLITEGLARLRAQGAAGVALIGDPKYYGRFGFKNNGPMTYGETDRKVVHSLSFGGEEPHGALRFNPAFDTGKDGPDG